jgi:ElaB/YqjD/DUF883 family membrane-anchored ribosome-binding protein
MATAIRYGELKDRRAEPCAWPTLESIEEAVRTARRAATEARHATEDAAAGASLRVRRHPLASVGLAATAGIVTGSLVGFAAGWLLQRRG